MRIVTVLPVALLALIVPTLQAEPPACLTARAIRKMCADELEALFRQGSIAAIPTGTFDGRVLLVVDAKCPRTQAGLQSAIWKGKVISCDGEMINRWCGFRAVKAPVHLGSSWLDGAPCAVIDYAPDAPVFGNTRDEIREVAPGLYLGRFYEKCPCGKLKGYFLLESRGCAR
ncbi:MAG: hypothetical protein U0840_29115 [Gemmataceae bacterium]